MSAALVAARDFVLKAFPTGEPTALSIHAGEHWLVVGEAGAGKTSLAKSLLGIVSLARGSIELFGKPVDGLTPTQLLALRRQAGVVFAGDGLISAWTGLDNLALPLRLAGETADVGEIDAMVRSWCARYRIPGSWLDTGCGALTRDARLTLSLARALIKGPKLLLLDGVPIDNALAYDRRSGLAMLGDFAQAGGSMLVLVREAYAERFPESALALDFHRARIEDGRLQFADDSRPGALVRSSDGGHRPASSTAQP